MADSPLVTLADVHKDLFAGEFLAQMAAEIQSWQSDNTFRGADNGNQWVLTATLADDTQIVIHQLNAHGHSIIKLRGQLRDVRPALIISHLHSVQFLATYIPRQIKEPVKREIGFHTGLKEIKIKQ